MSGRQVLVDVEALEDAVRFLAGPIHSPLGMTPYCDYCNASGIENSDDNETIPHGPMCPVPALKAALTTPPTTPDKPEPEQEALVGLARSWEAEAILLYAQEARVRDGSVIWHDQECKAEHDALRQCAAELLARLPQEDTTP